MDGRRIADGLWLFEPRSDDAGLRRTLVKRHLAGLLGCPPEALDIRPDAFGKPHLLRPTARLRFNLAHRDGRLLIGTAWDRPIGVDLEIAAMAGDDLDQAVVRALFAPAEAEGLAALDPAGRRRAFLRLWTGKEAVLKARGRGIVEGVAEPDLAFWLDRRGPSAEEPITVRMDSEFYDLSWYSVSTSAGEAIAAHSLGGTCLSSEKSAL